MSERGRRARGASELQIDEDFCRALGRRFWIDGHEPEDVAQIARIAMWQAPAGVEYLAARRAVIEALRRARRGGRPTFRALVDVHPDPGDLVDVVAARDELRRILGARLSPLERTAIGRVIRGEPCPKGRLDNARQRALRKLAA